MIKFNKNGGTVEPFTIILSNRNQEWLGQISNLNNVNFTGNFNAADELSFSVNKIVDDYEEPLWDELYDFRLVYIKELNEYFEIYVSLDEQDYLTKTITAKSLCEAELSQTMLYDIEINTETDISRDDYIVAKFWTNSTDPQSEEYKSTILYRVLEKVPAYSVKHVDDTLVNLQRVFSINGKSVYDWLISDCSTEFNCLVKFDSTDRTISFYDLYTTCPVCHARGIFNDKCTHIITEDDLQKYGINGLMPNGTHLHEQCGNSNLNYYGEDTTIFVSTENLTDEINLETDTDSVKNSFRLVAGDDDMTAAIVNINPNGSQYIYNYSPESLKDMPNILVNAIKDYNQLYDEYNYIKAYNINIPYKKYYYRDIANNRRITVNANYNTIVQKYNHSYQLAKEEELFKIPSELVGYAKLMQHIYQCLDFYSYLESSMMPKVEIGGITAQTEAEKVQEHNGDTISLSSFGSSTNVKTVTSAVINYLKVFVKTGYVKLEVNENDPIFINHGNNGTWTGTIKVIFYSLDDDDTDKEVDVPCTFTIDGNYEDFIKQKLMKKLASDLENEDQIYNLLDPGNNMSLATFQDNLKAYSLNRLRSFKDSLEALLGIMQEANIALKPSEQKDSLKRQVYNDFYIPCLNRFKACEEEYNLRANELSLIAKYTNGSLDSGLLHNLLSIRDQVQDSLNFVKFLDKRSASYNEEHEHETGFEPIDMYKLLTTYTRQDEYSNSNYISVGLTSSELFQMAQMFYDAAREELIKSSTYQHSINANLYNLLAIDEFQPIVDKFELGNWLRVQIDEQVYRLRLISYSINFDDLTTLNTQFSDLTATALGYNDLQSILNQAGTMSTSYPAVTRQAEKGKLANENINEWVRKGLNSAKTRIMNNDAEEIEITNTGITARTYNDVTDEYDDEQLRITHNVLAFTDDNWETVKTALGKYTLTHHIPHKTNTNTPGVIKPIEEEYYGLVAEAVLAGWIVGSTIESSSMIGGHIQGVGNKTYIDLDPLDTTIWDSDGYNYTDFIHVENGDRRFIVTKEGNIQTTGGHFSNMDDTAYLDLNENNPYFLRCDSSDSTGMSTFRVTKTDGTLISTGGHFQNRDNSVYIDFGADGQQTTYLRGNTLAKDYFEYFLLCKDPELFSVGKDGYLIATSGEIGGFYISDHYISSTKSLGSTEDSHITMDLQDFSRNMYLSSPTFDSDGYVISVYSGMKNVTDLRFAIGINFGVANDGSVYAKNLFIRDLQAADIWGRNLKVVSSKAKEAYANTGGFGLIRFRENSIYIPDTLDGLNIQNICFVNDDIKNTNTDEYVAWKSDIEDINDQLTNIREEIDNIDVDIDTVSSPFNVGDPSGYHAQISDKGYAISVGNQNVIYIGTEGDRGPGIYFANSSGQTLWYINSTGFHN